MNESTVKAMRFHLGSLQRELAEHRDFLARLRVMPAEEAVQAIRRLQSAASHSSTPDALSTAMGMTPTSYRPSEVQTRRGLLAPAQSETEFELQMLHPAAFPPLDPLDAASLDAEHWFRPANHPSSRSPVSALEPSPPSSLQESGSTEQASAKTASSAEWQHCDERLRLINMTYWSRISIDNELAANVLSHFFTAHFPVFACFDAHLFLDDLIQQEVNYCSAFLVSSIMAIACQSYTTFDVRCSSLSAAFEREAEMLWYAERSTDTPINLAAMCYLAMASSTGGHESLAMLLLADIRTMATRMNLFGAQPSPKLLATFHHLPTDKFKALASAAWGAYGWLTYHATHYPADPIDFPPTLPIPGNVNRQSGGLLWPPHALPEYVGQTTTNLCRLWPIVQELDHVYSLKRPVPLAQRIPLAFAEAKYQKLLAWADEFHSSMHRDERSVSHVYFFHALYHCTLIRVFQPFLGNLEAVRLRSLKSKDSSPSSVFAASMRQLKRLLVWYWVGPGRHSENGWFNFAILQIANAVLKNTADPDWRIYFQLCFNFWKEAYVRYRVYLKVAKANLALALRLGAIKGPEAVAMLDDLRSVGTHHVAPEDAFLTAIADFEMSSKDPNIDGLDQPLYSNYPPQQGKLVHDRDHFTAVQIVQDIWRALDLPEHALESLDVPESHGPVLPSSYRIGAVAQGTVALSALGAALVYTQREKGTSVPRVTVSARKAAVEFMSERLYVLEDQPQPAPWNALGGLHKTSDGYVRIHSGFPNHAYGALDLLGLPKDARREDVAQKVACWKSIDLENAGTSEGKLAIYALRSYAQWDATAQAEAIPKIPVLLNQLAAGSPTALPPTVSKKCLQGLRVVEMSRVIAAPVAGRTLAAHGADVIWITSPSLPDLPIVDRDVSRGKRTVQLDINKSEDKARLLELIKTCDVFIQGYRPGSLAAHGLSQADIVRANPNIIYASLSAFGRYGPWSGRRGFDSLVQTCSGMNVSEAEHAGLGEAARPMPCQALDHASGYFLATGISAALYHRASRGGAWGVDVSLAGTMKYLRSLGQYAKASGFTINEPLDVKALPEEYFETRDTGFGSMKAVRHSPNVEGCEVGWEIMPKPLGSDQPEWV
ncbi:Acetyl-coenzyme A transferase nodX [Paramyrothecium foliicola]|nr:Acetyl-coenzyme A transferase nodX [Paramyrothecium foliicola]